MIDCKMLRWNDRLQNDLVVEIIGDDGILVSLLAQIWDQPLNSASALLHAVAGCSWFSHCGAMNFWCFRHGASAIELLRKCWAQPDDARLRGSAAELSMLRSPLSTCGR
jgi:hypothetical protein